MNVTLPNGKTILAEAMRTDFDRTRGMMFRDSLAKDRGMLFVHTKEELHPYWTYNCRIPLDVVWMNHDHRVVEVAANAPPCNAASSKECPSYGGHEKSQFVLELNGGGAAGEGLRVGDTLTF